MKLSASACCPLGLVFLLGCHTTLCAEEGSTASRLEQLEEAVRQLKEENESLKREMKLLKDKHTDSGSKPAGTEKSSPFVIPLGKESKLVLGGFLHANGEFGDVSAFEGRLPGGPNEIDDRFRLRRARIAVSGDFVEDFDFKLEGDFQQSDGLSGSRTAFSGTDLFVNWHRYPEANLKVGQFKAPLGLEQLTSAVRIFTAERTLVTGAITPQRQIGVQIWGEPLATASPGQKDLLSYKLGVFNGNGRNITINDNDQFMYAGRVESTPLLEKWFDEDVRWRVGFNTLHAHDAANVNLSQAGNLALQTDGSLLAFSTHTPDERWAWGVDQTLTIGPFDLVGEYLEEKVRPRTGGASFREFTATGYYIQGSYYFWEKKLQFVSKWESFNPDQAADDDLDSLTAGLNYYLSGDQIKLMLNYIHTWSDFRSANPGLGRDEFDELLLRLQLLF